MQEVFNRMMDEGEELAVKVEKLEKFLETEAYNNIGRLEKDLLLSQHSIMLSYLNILSIRASLLNERIKDQNSAEGTE